MNLELALLIRVPDAAADGEPSAPKEEANYGLSGKLAAETNTYRGVVLKFSEPPEARMPSQRWRLYIFKGEEQLEPLRIYKQSFFLCGKDYDFLAQSVVVLEVATVVSDLVFDFA